MGTSSAGIELKIIMKMDSGMALSNNYHVKVVYRDSVMRQTFIEGHVDIHTLEGGDHAHRWAR